MKKMIGETRRYLHLTDRANLMETDDSGQLYTSGIKCEEIIEFGNSRVLAILKYTRKELFSGETTMADRWVVPGFIEGEYRGSTSEYGLPVTNVHLVPDAQQTGIEAILKEKNDAHVYFW